MNEHDHNNHYHEAFGDNFSSFSMATPENIEDLAKIPALQINRTNIEFRYLCKHKSILLLGQSVRPGSIFYGLFRLYNFHLELELVQEFFLLPSISNLSDGSNSFNWLNIRFNIKLNGINIDAFTDTLLASYKIVMKKVHLLKIDGKTPKE